MLLVAALHAFLSGVDVPDLGVIVVAIDQKTEGVPDEGDRYQCGNSGRL